GTAAAPAPIQGHAYGPDDSYIINGASTVLCPKKSGRFAAVAMLGGVLAVSAVPLVLAGQLGL
ncbi:unnamed protein product, partial [Tilletia laevis]